MATVEANKRGHHSEFALTKEEIQDLISFASNKRTRAMIVLASLGVPVRGIVIFKAKQHLFVGDGMVYHADITGITDAPIQINPKQYQLLSLFPDGFNVTNVTIWRRIKREILNAGREGVITLDPDHIPFPAALAYEPALQKLTSQQMVRWCLARVHALQQTLPGQDHGTPESCPHKDCERIRKWLHKK